MRNTTFSALRLETPEWHHLARILGVSVAPPGPIQKPSRVAVDAARESLLERRILTARGARMSTDVSALMFALARSATSCWVHRHGATHHAVHIGFHRRVNAIAWTDENDRIWISPTTPGSAARDVAAIMGIAHPEGAVGARRMSVAGGLWHDLVTQQPVASDAALRSLATAEGVTAENADLLVGLSRATNHRLDLRFVRPGGARRWVGSEVSVLPTDSGLWTVSDGRSFAASQSRLTTRATFSPQDLGGILLGRGTPGHQVVP